VKGGPLEIRAALRAIGVVPVIRSGTPDAALKIAHVLVDAGLNAVEITFSVPDAPAVIRELAADGLVVGAGTILEESQFADAVNAGAGFVVSPVNPGFLIAEAVAAEVLAIPGCATPTEIVAAVNAGAIAAKVFPAARLGGPAYLTDLLAPLPDLHLMPSGGIGIEEIPAYQRAGAWCVGIGGPLGGNMDAATRTAAAGRARELAIRT
jgi:2-dehydro-3-deoxyphosphogluconate aldolase/(4S)-4-hydroxy-2-oxoglutarate aldolase